MLLRLMNKRRKMFKSFADVLIAEEQRVVEETPVVEEQRVVEETPVVEATSCTKKNQNVRKASRTI